MRFLLLALLLLATPALAWNEPQSPEYQYKFVSGTLVSTIKSGSGFIHALTVTGGPTTAIDIYDGSNFTQSLMYSFTTTNALNTYILDVNFASGCVVYTGSLLKYTVSYK